jgi:hypothetical protein
VQEESQLRERLSVFEREAREAEAARQAVRRPFLCG